LSRSTSITTSQASESIVTIPHNETFLSPPQSASSSSQLTSNSIPNQEPSIPYQTTTSITFDDIVIPPETTFNNDDNDDDFWNILSEQSTQSTNEIMSTTNNDSVSDIYLTLLHSTKKDSSPIKTRTEHDRTVNSIATEILWPLIVDQTNRRNDKKSSSSTTTTTQTFSSNSSTTGGSSIRRNRVSKQLPSVMKSRRSHPYTTA
jgi:hypothetical protein